MTETTSSLIVELQKRLHNGKLDDAQNLITDGDQNVIKESGWDVIYYVLTHLRENLKNVDVVSCCDVILLHVAKTGNPKEVLLGFLEQIGKGVDYAILIILLKPIQMTLQRLPGKRGSTLKWTLDTLHPYIQNLPLPESYKYEGKERLLLDLDSNVQQTTEVLRHYLLFLKPFVEEASLLNAKKNTPFTERICYQRDILCHNLLLIVEHPLAYLDLSREENKAESNSRVCATNVMNYLKMLKGNTISLYDFVKDHVPKRSSDSAELEEEECDKELGRGKLSVIGASTLAYLTMKEQLGNVPLVYTPLYLLQIHLNFTVALISNKEELMQLKGLHLVSSVLLNIEVGSLSRAFLDIPEALHLYRSLINIMVYCGISEYRQHALSIFKSYTEKFDLNGRCCVLLSLLSSENHSGVRGLLIQMYKDNLHRAFTDHHNPFIGNNLQKALVLITRLPEYVETDLINESDCIIATLNFLRYLVISDNRKTNRTGIWNFIDDPSNAYFKDLRTGITLSKAHYKLKSVKMAEERKSTKTMNPVVQPRGVSLPNLPPDQQSFVLQSALLTFDMMESILVRLEEHI